MIVLDRHTAPLFAPEFGAGEVEASFNIRGRSFEARFADDIRGNQCLVMQLDNNRASGSFVAQLKRYDVKQIEAAGSLSEYAYSKFYRAFFHVERLCFFESPRCMIALSNEDKHWGGAGRAMERLSN